MIELSIKLILYESTLNNSSILFIDEGLSVLDKDNVNKTQDINGAPGDIAKQSITFTVNGATTVATTGTF